MDAILLGSGSGSRFSGASGSDHSSEELPKQFRMLGQAPVFIHALRSFLRMNCFRQIVIATPKHLISHAQELIDSHIPPQATTIIRVIAGGERRQDSSYLALEAVEAVSPPPDRVVIHDACRPYLSPDFLERIRTKLLDRSYGAWVPVVPVVDTLKRVDNEQVVETVDRHLIHRVQTPQVFEFTVIRSLVDKVKENDSLNFTDDASLCEYYGIPVGVFEGDVRNIKLTYEFELEALKRLVGEENAGATPCEPHTKPASASIYTV